ncbi:MAG: VWA domain-containing protein [Chloroflexales bacterium]|nr:VWA domain-containing protein [Chloroflexales bacterium]
MNLLWPGFLILLGVLPLLVAGYVWMLRRRRRFAVRYSSLSLVRAALPRYSRLRRHGPFALFLLALGSLVIALGRPVASVVVPSGQTTVVLTLDVSRSMLATDIPPSRFEAAITAALSFIQSQRANTQIGLVAFAGFAEMIQPPTTDQEALQDAVESLTTGRGTAMGSGILEALDVIAQIDPNVAPSVSDSMPGVAPAPVPAGTYAPSVIVVLTDGVTTTGPEPLDAAQQAADRGVRVYTIGFGTENGSAGGQFGGQPNGQQGGNDPFAGGRFRRGIDEATLKEVAAMTGGDYYAAESADQLLEVFQQLPTTLITKRETTEISVVFAGIGALLAALAVGLSLRWNPLP